MGLDYSECSGPTVVKKFSRENYTMSYPVRPQHNGLRLDQFLALYLPSFGRNRIQKKILAQEVRIVGRKATHRASTKLKERQQVEISFYAKAEMAIPWNHQHLPLSFDLPIIGENEDLLVVNKPPFMATHPTGRHVFHCATVILEDRYKKPFHSVHRLDRETSGTLVFPKHKEAASRYTRYFEDSEVQKVYFLLAHKKNHPHFPFTADESLGPKEGSELRPFSSAFPANSGLGKNASTEFEFLDESENHLACLAFPRTGRQHQIRVHAAHHGMPIVGDKLYSYGPEYFYRFQAETQTDHDYQAMQHPRQILHCLAMRFPQEQNRDELFLAYPPSDIMNFLNDCLMDWSKIWPIAEKIIQKKFSK